MSEGPQKFCSKRAFSSRKFCGIHLLEKFRDVMLGEWQFDFRISLDQPTDGEVAEKGIDFVIEGDLLDTDMRPGS